VEYRGDHGNISSIRHRAFSLLISGQTLSRIGDFLYQVAVAWWVLEKTNSGIAIGMVFLFSLTPTILCVLLGGALVSLLPLLHPSIRALD